MSSVNLEKILADAKRLSGRLKEHDSTADTLVKQAHNLQRQVDSVKMYQENLADLQKMVKEQQQQPAGGAVVSAAAAAGPVAAAAGPAANAEPATGHLYTGSGLILENREIKQLTEENEELKQLLDDHQLTLELIMKKYRQRVSSLITEIQSSQSQALPQIKNGIISSSSQNTIRICDMAQVMRKAVSLDEEEESRTSEMIAQLQVENRAMKELLSISETYGSRRTQRDTCTQTEANKRAQAVEQKHSGTSVNINKQKNITTESNCNVNCNNTCDADLDNTVNDIDGNLTSQTVDEKTTTKSDISGEVIGNCVADSSDSKTGKVSSGKDGSNATSYSTTTIRRNRGKTMKAMLVAESDSSVNHSPGSDDLLNKATGIPHCSENPVPLESSRSLSAGDCSDEKSKSAKGNGGEESKDSMAYVSNVSANGVDIVANSSLSLVESNFKVDSAGSGPASSNSMKSNSEISRAITSNILEGTAVCKPTVSGASLANGTTYVDKMDATQCKGGSVKPENSESSLPDSEKSDNKDSSLLNCSKTVFPLLDDKQPGDSRVSVELSSSLPIQNSDSTSSSAINSLDPDLIKRVKVTRSENIPLVQSNFSDTSSQETVLSSKVADNTHINDNRKDNVVGDEKCDKGPNATTSSKLSDSTQNEDSSSRGDDCAENDITISESDNTLSEDTDDDVASLTCESVSGESTNCLEELESSLSEEPTNDSDTGPDAAETSTGENFAVSSTSTVAPTAAAATDAAAVAARAIATAAATAAPVSIENVKDTKTTAVRNVKSATSVQTSKPSSQHTASRPAAKSASATSVRSSPAATNAVSKAPIKPIVKAGSPAVNRSPGGPVKGSTPPRSMAAVKKGSSANSDVTKTSAAAGSSVAGKSTAAVGSAAAARVGSPATTTSATAKLAGVSDDAANSCSSASKSAGDGVKTLTVVSPSLATKPAVSNTVDGSAKTSGAVKSSSSAAAKSPLSAAAAVSKTTGKPIAAVAGTVRSNAAGAKSPKS